MSKIIIIFMLIVIPVGCFGDLSPQDSRKLEIIASGSALEWSAFLTRTDPNYILYIGDSTVQNFPYMTPCGAKVVNGGVGGTGLQWWVDNIDSILSVLHPRLVLIQIGVNDAQKPVDQTLKANWPSMYISFAQKIAGYGAYPGFMTILPIEENAPLGSLNFDNDTIKYYNKYITDCRLFWNLPNVDTWSKYANAQGFLGAGWTLDGVHPTQAFYSLIVNDVINAIQQVWWFSPTCTDR